MDNKKIILNLHKISIEANLQKSQEEVLEILDENPNSNFDKYLQMTKQYKTKARAKLNKSRYTRAKDEVVKLIDKTGSKIKELFTDEEYTEIVQFYNNHKNTSERDKESLLSNKKLLEILEKLKDEQSE